MESTSDMLIRESPIFTMRPVTRPLGVTPSTSAPVPGVKVITFRSIGRERAETARMQAKSARVAVGNIMYKKNERSRNGWNSDDVWNGAPR
jgi:hypothetical protein